MCHCFGKILPAGVLESPGVFQEMLDLIFNPCCGHTEINQKVPHKQLASAGVKWHKIALSDLFGAFWPNHYLWISSVEGCRQGELTPVLPDQSAVDTSHCFKSLPWRLFTFWKDNHHHHQIFRGLSYHLIMLASTSWRRGLILNSCCSVHRLTAQKKGKEKQFLRELCLKVTSMQNQSISVTAPIFQRPQKPSEHQLSEVPPEAQWITCLLTA